MDTVDPAIGRRLKAARTAAGMKTRQELTDAAGLHRVGAKVLGMIERGQRQLQPHEAEAFAQALNIDKSVFYDEPDGTQLDRLEQSLAVITQREERAQEDRDAILKLLAKQDQILTDIAGLLQRQEAILVEMSRVADGLPDDENLRMLNEAAQELTEVVQRRREARSGTSSEQADGDRRVAGEP